MDRRKAVFVIGLALIVTLYIVALGMGVRFNAGGGGSMPASLEDATARLPKWARNLLAGSVPRLALENLECTDGGDTQSVSGIDLRLSGTGGSSSCSIDIGGSDEAQRRSDLAVREPALAIYVKARFDEGDFPRGDCLSKHPAEFRLEVDFEPENGSGSQQCLVERDPTEPVPITVLEDGGRLTLTLYCDKCRGAAPDCPCDRRETHSARIRLE